MLAYKDETRVRPISRQGLDHAARFADFAAAIAKLHASTLVLDGEVAAFDKDLVSRFHLLGEPEPAEVCTPPILIAFDVPQVGRSGVETCDCCRSGDGARSSRTSSASPISYCRCGASTAGPRYEAAVQARGYEGLVAKDPTSTYREGSTRSWRAGQTPAPRRG
jgi:ATP-dependent DNA ligase